MIQFQTEEAKWKCKSWTFNGANYKIKMTLLEWKFICVGNKSKWINLTFDHNTINLHNWNFQLLSLQLSSAEWPNSRECWLVYVEVDTLLDTPLEPAWFPIQNLNFLKVYLVAQRLDVDMSRRLSTSA